jgi:hypothetical protein
MAYSDFTLESVAASLGVTTEPATLFPDLSPVPVPAWLADTLAKNTPLTLISEKARSEFIVVPILRACRELSNNRLAIFSGQRLDVDPERGLAGECDFLLALAPPLPPLRAPLVSVVEAKKNDIEAGLGQCVAQMVAAALFNRSAGRHDLRVFGCVTTGEVWQFLQLREPAALVDERRYYLDNVGLILAAVQAIVARGGGIA